MSTSQTIDGVPRELLELALLELEDRWSWAGELRTLLDVSLTDEGERPADPKPTGLSQGWNLTRKHDGFVVGHQSVAYPPDEKAIERAERDGYVWVPFLLPAAQPKCSDCNDTGRMHEPGCEPGACTACLERTAAQPQGEPVAWMDPRSPEMHATISNEVKQHNLKFGGAPSAAVNGYSIPLYAEQPTPVAVVLPERRDPTQDNPYLSDADHEWNAYRDELKRLNPSL